LGIRQYKFMFDGLRAATLNVTNNPDEADYILDNSHDVVFQDKKLFGHINRELNISMPREYDYDETEAENINHPVILKPVLGKGAFDVNGSRQVYKTFPNGRGLITAFQNENIPLNAEAKRKLYFIQEAITETNGDVTQIHGFALINGSGEIRIPFIYQQTWKETPVYNCERGLISPATRAAHHDVCMEYAQKFVQRYGLKNTCLYIQCVVKDGVYYYTDADARIPHTYCTPGLWEYFPEHLRFIYDAASDITIPNTYVIQHDLQNMRLSPEYHENLLASRHGEFDAFYWIARKASDTESLDGRYMILVSGDTEAEAETKLSNYVSYLTEDVGKTPNFDLL
jgi:hypothetical protein